MGTPHRTEVACSLLGLAGPGSDSVVESSSRLATLLLFLLLLAIGTSSSELLDATETLNPDTLPCSCYIICAHVLNWPPHDICLGQQDYLQLKAFSRDARQPSAVPLYVMPG